MARPKGTEKTGLKYLNEKELDHFFKAVDSAKNPMYSLAFRLTLFLGLRVQELCNIQLNDINSDSFQIAIKAIKNGRARVYDLNGRLWHRLQKWMKERERFGYNGKNLYLFCSSRYFDEPVSPQSFKGKFKKYSEQAGLNGDFSIHSLRHSCGIIHAKNGESPIAIMLWLRHRSVKSTQTYFEQVEFEKQAERASEIFSQFL